MPAGRVDRTDKGTGGGWQAHGGESAWTGQLQGPTRSVGRKGVERGPAWGLLSWRLTAGRKRPRCAGGKRKRLETACVSWQGGVNTKEKRTVDLKWHWGLAGNTEQGFAQPSPEVVLAAAESRGQSEGSLYGWAFVLTYECLELGVGWEWGMRSQELQVELIRLRGV